MALKINAIVIVKSVAKPLEADGLLFYFNGEINRYNPDSKREKPISYFRLSI
jgi:hypothetical protein